jgi:tetratricopeptide (TPR) repeat protein
LRSAEGQKRMARRVAAVAEPYGPIFEAELERIGSVAAEDLDTRACVLLFYEFRRVLSSVEHAQALDCFRQATTRDPDDAEALGGLAQLYAEGWAQGFSTPEGDELLDRAREAARHGMDVDGSNMRANLALVAVQFFSGADPRAGAERMLALWPENAEVQAFLGAVFILLGDTGRGKTLVESAIEWTPNAPSGYHATLALAALREQRYADALALALRIDSPDWALGHVIVAAAGAHAGRPDLAVRARARALDLSPTIETVIPVVLRRWRFEPALAEEIERGFSAAAAQVP